MNEADVNKAITATIIAAANEHWPTYREGIQQLASWWRTMAHQTGQVAQYRNSFRELCEHIENEAVAMANDGLLRMKIKTELQNSQKQKIQVLH